MTTVGRGLGARYEGDGWTRFRVWAPDRQRIDVAVEAASGLRHLPLERGADGYFEGRYELRPGTRYRFRIDGGDHFNDPCSRFQPEGPHGPSEIVDPGAFRWSDHAWRGVPLEGAVLYELHLGTFTPEGTYAAAEAKLPYLRELGITALEVMPLNTFPGRFNWGYDGTHLFAPCAVYGSPDELRRFVDAAHREGLAVLLDVVYNHFGPDGNYLWQYARRFFSETYAGEWGEPPNFDGPDSGPVREFFVENVRHWISEYHFDGLRIDATQSLFDASPRHLISELTDAARAAAPHRTVLIVAENEPQDRRAITPTDRGGFGCDTMWIDDFHHSARVALTFHAEAYTQDYRGTASELVACARHNSLYQGQYYAWQKQPRGTPLRDVEPRRCVFFLQDHDQIANFLGGDRLHSFSPQRARALTVLWLSLPQTPMFFMGQEFFASTSFLYFVDHKPELQELVRQGRMGFMSQFRSAEHAFHQEGWREEIGEEAFRRSRLDWSEVEKHAPALLLHRELLRLRREDPLLSPVTGVRPDGCALGEQALALRWFDSSGDADRLLLLNLGAELSYDPCPQPLLAPPPGRIWEPVLSSEQIKFGGRGAIYPTGEDTWTIPGQCGLILKAGGESKARETPLEQARDRKRRARP